MAAVVVEGHDRHRRGYGATKRPGRDRTDIIAGIKPGAAANKHLQGARPLGMEGHGSRWGDTAKATVGRHHAEPKQSEPAPFTIYAAAGVVRTHGQTVPGCADNHAESRGEKRTDPVGIRGGGKPIGAGDEGCFPSSYHPGPVETNKHLQGARPKGMDNPHGDVERGGFPSARGVPQEANPRPAQE